MVTRYQAVCRLHPDYSAEQHDGYAEAVADLRQHNDEQHSLDVVTIESDE